jgi:ABC-type histidine transport system ATPase subunit
MADGEIVEQGRPSEVFNAPRHERLRAFISQIERH